MTTQVHNPTITIALTGRRPVTVVTGDWPIIAEASDRWCDNQYECQANRTSKWRLAVRQHSDGRAIIYGTYQFSSNFPRERDYAARAGELLDAGLDLPAAIRRVGKEMASREQADGDAGRWPTLIADCIASLTAEEI